MRMWLVFNKVNDWWHVFEMSWLNAAGVPQVAIGPDSLACHLTESD